MLIVIMISPVDLFFPLKASEWFYEYPDTFQIRANWEIDVGQIEKE